jgi:hypothetical protein
VDFRFKEFQRFRRLKKTLVRLGNAHNTGACWLEFVRSQGGGANFRRASMETNRSEVIQPKLDRYDYLEVCFS